MPEILNYAFFQNALMSIVLISISCAVVGTYIVARRLVFITGGITHASFGGLGVGFFLGVNPTLSALLFALLSGFGVEWITRRNSVREDSAIAAFWSLGMAIGVIFIFLTPGYTPGLTEFLFGNLLTITYTDLILFSLYTVVLLAFFALCLRPIIYVAFDRDFARTQRLPVRFIEYTMMFFISVCVVLTIRLIGIMLMMSMVTIPQNTADLFKQRFGSLVLLSAAISITGGVGGLFLSYWLNVPASACIIFVLVLFYVLAKLIKLLKKKRNAKA